MFRLVLTIAYPLNHLYLNQINSNCLLFTEVSSLRENYYFDIFCLNFILSLFVGVNLLQNH